MLWLVAIATILIKTIKIHFLFMSAIAHNWYFFTKRRQTFWSIYRAVRFRALAWDIVLYSLARYFTVTVPLALHPGACVPSNIVLGGSLAMDQSTGV